MSEDLNPYDDDFDIDDFDNDDCEYVSYGTQVGRALTPNVKQYLADYFGDKMAELDAETYLDIEEIIKDTFFYECDMIPDLLYNNRSIPHEEFDAYLDNFKYTGKRFDWPRPKYWFDKEYTDEEDNEFETYLNESDPIDLADEEMKVKNALDAANNFLDYHVGFAGFVKKGFDILSKDMQNYLEDTTSADLDILTPEGFDKLQDTIHWLFAEMLNKLYGTIGSDLEGKE